VALSRSPVANGKTFGKRPLDIWEGEVSPNESPDSEAEFIDSEASVGGLFGPNADAEYLHVDAEEPEAQPIPEEVEWA
jgi:hypothetical protein